LKSDIADEYRCSDDPDDKTPGMCVTVSTRDMTTWSYQTGDNSFTGSCYGDPHWSVIYLYRRSNCTELAQDAVSELADAVAEASESEQLQTDVALARGLQATINETESKLKGEVKSLERIGGDTSEADEHDRSFTPGTVDYVEPGTKGWDEQAEHNRDLEHESRVADEQERTEGN
jgi:hypothetical protein